MKTKVTVKGSKELIDKLNKFDNKVNSGLTKELQRFAYSTAHGAKMNLQEKVYTRGRSVKSDTLGQLKVMIQPKVTSNSASVTVPVSYAPYVEFGTGTKVNIPKGLEDYASQFKGKDIREVNLPARPFLFPAAEKAAKEFIKNIKKLLKP